MTSSDSRDANAGGSLPRRAFRALDLLTGDKRPFGVAVSGGSDSTALLVLATDWGRRAGVRIAAATVDHGLRAEAAAEAQTVAALCADLGVPHATLQWRRAARSGQAGQAEARRARHALLATWAREQNIPAIALGHTRDDRLETFLMRARQGSGWHGLAGPLPSGPSPVWPEGRGLATIRPLLAFARDDLRGELAARGFAWIEDPSNAARRYERVRVRSLWGRMDDRALAQTIRVMDGLAHMRAAVMAEARAALARIDIDGSTARMSRADLRRLGPEARLRLVEALIMAAGGGEKPARREALERICARLAEGAGLAAGATLAGAWLRPAAGGLTITRAPLRRGQPPGAEPAWDRAGALLADPKAAALAV